MPQNVDAASDNSGVLKTTNDYTTAYGETTQTGEAYPYGFTGRRYIEDLELYDYRARWYDPKLGRFLQRDPIGVWGDLENLGNPYTYVANDPVDHADPTGKDFRPCQLGCISASEINRLVANVHGQRGGGGQAGGAFALVETENRTTCAEEDGGGPRESCCTKAFWVARNANLGMKGYCCNCLPFAIRIAREKEKKGFFTLRPGECHTCDAFLDLHQNKWYKIADGCDGCVDANSVIHVRCRSPLGGYWQILKGGWRTPWNKPPWQGTRKKDPGFNVIPGHYGH